MSDNKNEKINREQFIGDAKIMSNNELCEKYNIKLSKVGDLKRKYEIARKKGKFSVKDIQDFLNKDETWIKKNGYGYTLTDNKINNGASSYLLQCPNCQTSSWKNLGSIVRRFAGCKTCKDKKSAIQRTKWTLESLRQFISNDQNWIKKHGDKYEVLGVNEVSDCNVNRSVILKCSNGKHDSIEKPIGDLVDSLSGCSLCWYEGLGERQKRDINEVVKEFNEYGLVPVDINRDYKRKDSRIECEVIVEDVKYTVSTQLQTVRKSNGAQTSIFHTDNPFTIKNINSFCLAHRPDYKCNSLDYINASTPLIFEYCKR
ncbi:hypothetical protein ACFRCQ_22815 [Cytobacillus firmus]|uniref:hypothetical protein n=1 Tax=Cytobacillus firmus TaxID=1399 RepID=UPI003693000C